jgi:hypothetical protein
MKGDPMSRRGCIIAIVLILLAFLIALVSPNPFQEYANQTATASFNMGTQTPTPHKP